ARRPDGRPVGYLPPDRLPAPGTDPYAVRHWWAGLTDEQRRFAVGGFPERVGALDGVPVDARDQANRILLARARLHAGTDRETLAGVEPGYARLEHPAPGAPRAYLLGFSTAGTGRAVMAIGNPDTADHIATYVPGTFTRLSGDIRDHLGRVEAMAADAARFDPGRATATIMWLG